MLDAGARTWLRERFHEAVRFDEPMARHTSLRIGGPAEALVAPESVHQLEELLNWTRKQDIPYTVIGGGTNLLVSDAGIRGVTIYTGRLTVPLEWVPDAPRVRLTVGAGIPTKRLCALAVRQGWEGMNFALGIPGLLGGAVCMNAGTARGSLADVVTAVTLLNSEGVQVCLERKRLNFDYRSLALPETGRRASIVIQADIELTVGDPASIRGQAREMMQARARRQPTWAPSAGCFFKNPSLQRPAGRLIDEAGLKGATVGGAQVSERHANFIINRGGATATDVLRLKAKIEETVWRRFGVQLQLEVHIVGQIKDVQDA